jgi:hypothetical protein
VRSGVQESRAVAGATVGVLSRSLVTTSCFLGGGGSGNPWLPFFCKTRSIPLNEKRAEA